MQVNNISDTATALVRKNITVSGEREIPCERERGYFVTDIWYITDTGMALLLSTILNISYTRIKYIDGLIKAVGAAVKNRNIYIGAPLIGVENAFRINFQRDLITGRIGDSAGS